MRTMAETAEASPTVTRERSTQIQTADPKSCRSRVPSLSEGKTNTNFIIIYSFDTVAPVAARGFESGERSSVLADRLIPRVGGMEE